MSEGIGFSFATFGASERDQILDLVNLVQPNAPWTSAHFEWQYLSPPAGRARVLLGRIGDEVVSLIAAVPHHFVACGVSAVAWRVQDVMTHPAHRGHGYFRQLLYLLDESLEELGFVFPNRFSLGGFRGLGWVHFRDVPEWLRSVAGNRFPSHTMVQVDAFDRLATQLWTRSGFTSGVVRDEAYLNWRYAKPGSSYQRFVLADGSGLCVLKVYNREGIRTVHICELLVDECRPAALPEALESCAAFAVAAKARNLTAWTLIEGPYGPAFEKAGFRCQSRNAFLMNRLWSESFDPRSFHVSCGDNDIY